MHLRPVFTETDLDRIADLIARHPFGLLVTQGDDTPFDGSHIPFGLERAGDALLLTGHLAVGNRQCALLDGARAMAVFSGPHAYISPSWYMTQPAVPTWDYAAVHVHGVLEPVTETEHMMDLVQDLATEDPAHFDIRELPADYRTGMMKGIRAFKLRADRIEAQWKMSQNRSRADREGVISALRAAGEAATAELIEQTLLN